MKLRTFPFWLLLSVPLGFLLLCYFYPMTAILRTSFATVTATNAGGFLSAFTRLLNASTWRILGFTFTQAFLSTALTLLLGLPGAYIFAHYTFPGKRLLTALTSVPFVLPNVVVAAAFTAVLGPQSPLNSVLTGMGWPPLDLRYTLGAILLAHVFYNYTLILRIVGGFWANLDPHLSEAARTLGASPWRTGITVTLPLLMPAIAAAAMLIFIFCFTSFGVILVLGGPRFATLEVAIYRQTVNYANLPVAAGLSWLQIACTLSLTLIYTRLQSTLARPLDLRPQWATQRRPRGAGEIAFVALNVGLTSLLLGLPLLTLAARSFDAGWRYYTALFENPRHSIFYVPPFTAARNSVGIALVTVGLAVGMGTLVSLALYRRRRGWLWDAIFMLPLGTSAVTLGLGYLLSMGRWRGTPLLIVLSHTLVALPFVVRSLLPALQAIRPSLREAAATLGATPARVFVHVDLPSAWRALIVGSIFAFTVSLGEFGATSLLARPDMPTLPIAIYRFLSKPGALNYGQAMAMSTLLMLVCIVGFITAELIGDFGIGDL